jgi:hypothetical protein
VGRRFAISGGRQIVFAEDARDATDFGTAAAVDGWCGQFEAVPATERGKMTLSVLARASSYSPPARPFEESGTMWVAEYVADLGLEDGGGALLGSASAGDAREGAWLLFLRARFVE